MNIIRNLLVIFALINIPQSIYSQSIAQKDVENIIYKFFESFRTIDTSYLQNIMTSTATLSSSFINKDGKPDLKSVSKNEFIKSISKSFPGELDERIDNLNITVSDGISMAKMDYQFYYKDKPLHCGKNFFTLSLMDNQWQIASIFDTRKNDCNDSVIAEINNTLEKWHNAAAKADSTTYFNLIKENGIFVGTDKSEVWEKNAFLKFAAPYFAKGKAWAFTTINRNIYLGSEDIVWFDEMLDTWMGPCRGSGVVIKENDEWKIAHYVLSVTVDNDDIQEFIKIGKGELSDD